jgi:hypothetical protein
MATTYTIHHDIESWLAAAVHGQLSPDERRAFDEHLATCATCRALHAEELTMHTMIENTLRDARPDLALEQRIVSRFRRAVPQRRGFTSAFANFFRWRATQVAAAAAVLLTLVQVGRVVTNEAPFEVSPAAEPQHAVAAPRLKRSGASTGGAVDFRRPATAPAPPPAESFSRSAPAIADATTDAPPPSNTFAQPAERVEAPQQETGAAAAEETIQYEPVPDQPAPAAPDNRKLIRNAQVELEVLKFDEAVQRITILATEDRGWIATTSSLRQANGKLRGEVVAKVLPEKLDAFLLKIRSLGDVKNQTLGTEDVTKQYFDTDARLNNARVMEQRLIDILKTKTGKVAELLEVERELGRVRAQIEEMQGSLKYLDAQIAFATVTITLAEKDMNEPAAFLLKRRATLALFSTDVEKTFAEVKGVIDGTKAQISSSSLDRDSTGEATARLTLLIVPEEADALIERIKGMGRVQNYNEQTDRVAQGGSGISDRAKVERDKVQLSITISRNEQEPALQTTSLRILTSGVTEKVARLKENAAKSAAEIRSSSFNRNPDGQETAYVTLRTTIKNYPAVMSSLDQLGKVKDVSVSRDDRRGVINEETAPADISIQIYSEGNIVSDESGFFATLRRTLAQGADALMWSLRMIGVALAFFAPWALALLLLVWGVKRVRRARAERREKASEQE